MLHRHLNHQGFTRAAIDDIISRGLLKDWIALRNAAINNTTLLENIGAVCHPRGIYQYAQRYAFWMHYANKQCGANSIDCLIVDQPNSLRPGSSLDYIETGIFEFRRVVPAADSNDAEKLRMLAIRILQHNAAGDYVALLTMIAQMGIEQVAQALEELDAFYPQQNGESVLQQLLVQLARVLPHDRNADDVGWLSVYAGCSASAVRIFDALPSAWPTALKFGEAQEGRKQ